MIHNIINSMNINDIFDHLLEKVNASSVWFIKDNLLAICLRPEELINLIGYDSLYWNNNHYYEERNIIPIIIILKEDRIIIKYHDFSNREKYKMLFISSCDKNWKNIIRMAMVLSEENYDILC